MNSEPVRGSRIGSTSNETSEGVSFSPRQTVVYRCPNEHETELIFAAEVEIPGTWDCKKCGRSALREGFEEPEEIIEGKVVRTHFDLLLERRSREELEVILKEALADLKERRKKNAS